MTLDHNDKRAIRNLLIALEDGRDPDLIGREHLTTPSHSVVPGWLIIKGPGRNFTVTAPGNIGREIVDAELDRTELIILLRAAWMVPARLAVGFPAVAGGPEPRVRHAHVSVGGVLAKSAPIVGLRDDAGNELDDHAARMRLLDLYAKGVRAIPLLRRCEGFNDVTGCPGHEVDQ